MALRDFAKYEDEDREDKGGKDEDSKRVEMRRMKHCVTQRPSRYRVLTLHLGICCCGCVVTYTVPKSDDSMVMAQGSCPIGDSVPDGRGVACM